jgi:transposase-like protein
MGMFSESEKKRLLSSKWVVKVTKNHVVFSPEFKSKVVQLHLDGYSPSDIFSKFEIDTSLFLPKYPAKCLERWKKTYLKKGAKGFKEETRGKGAKGRPKKKFDPTDTQSLLKRLAYLEAENDFLKKLHALADAAEKKNSR